MEIKLKGEALEYIPECTHLGRLISFWEKAGKKIKRTGVAWNKFNGLGFIVAAKYQTLEKIKKTSWHPAYFRS
jgi:hypothetical protein